MSQIRKLPESLIAKIAAGEVIERPFSVVKELVENSIDAGAKKIEVEVEDGGRKRILIIDDGIGMTREEALLALERHATSKLPDEESLFRIQTLGFRGEAVPSIAAISFMTLETHAREAQEGVKIEIEGGKIIKVGTSSIPLGTRINIENLFFNTPARLKFLKSKETEFSHIASWIEAIALGRPEITFHLRHNSKSELRTNATKDLRQRIGEVLGVEVAEFLHPVSARRGTLEIAGFVSDHRASSTSPKSLYLFVNGRIVRDRTMQHAVLSAYDNLLMKHRYPFAVLYLTIPPELVDVNVHPTKNEVRFANGKLVHELVREGVRSAVEGRGVMHYAPTENANVGAQFIAPSSHQSRLYAENINIPSLSLWPRPLSAHPKDHLPEPMPQTSTPLPLALSLRIIGQAHSTYLICETDEKLILIDQHAAHERIGFEKLKRQFDAGGIEKQQLLIPQNFDLRPSQGEILKKYLEDLAQIGLEIEFFGGNTFILRTLPTLLEGTDLIALIEELIESLQSFEKLTPFQERIHEVLERMACHAQVRAGQRLTNEEIESLISQMDKSPHANQCPHGRPSILEIPFHEMEKWFKRRL